MEPNKLTTAAASTAVARSVDNSSTFAPPPTLDVPSADLRIMIVEDDALIGMLLGDMLESMGHQVCAIEATETGAIEAAARCAPDLMIVDAHLRHGSGLAAVDQILAKGFVGHLFVTGDQRSVSKLRPGAVVISKPFTEAMLATAIQLVRKSP